MDNRTIDERLEEAINEAFDEYHAEKSEANVNMVKELVQLELNKRKVDNDYYCRASEIDNETQKIDEAKQKEIEDQKILNIMKKYIPEFVKTAFASLSMVFLMIIAKRYEEKGFLIKIPEIVKLVISKLGFGR